MKDIFTVTKFTAKDMIIRKSFIISTLIILVMIVVGFNIPNLLKKVNGEKDGGSKLLVVDSQNIFEGNLELLKNTDLSYEIKNAQNQILQKNATRKNLIPNLTRLND